MSTNRSVLANTPLVKDLSTEELDILSKIIYTKELKGNEFLITEGSSNNNLYGIIDGVLLVGKHTSGDHWLNFQRLIKGDLAGELGFIDGTPHSASIKAEGKCHVFILEREALEETILKQPMLAYHLLRAIIRIVHDILRRMNMQYVEMTNYITKQSGRY